MAMETGNTSTGFDADSSQRWTIGHAGSWKGRVSVQGQLTFARYASAAAKCVTSFVSVKLDRAATHRSWSKPDTLSLVFSTTPRCRASVRSLET